MTMTISFDFTPKQRIIVGYTKFKLLYYFSQTMWYFYPTPKGLRRQLDALFSFCDLKQVSINHHNIKTMIFNTSRATFFGYHVCYRVEPVEITITYTYLGVQFLGHLSTWNNQHSLKFWTLSQIIEFEGSLSTFFRYSDQRCLALFLQEVTIFKHRAL